MKLRGRARDVDFDLSECRLVPGLHRDSGRQSRRASALVVEKTEQLQQRIDSLLAMQQVLRDMASRCHGDEGPDCAILNDLASADESSL